MQSLRAPLPTIGEIPASTGTLGLRRLVSTYLFLICILFLSVRGTFSFLTNSNNEVAGTYGDLNASGADSTVHSIEYAIVYGLFALCIASRFHQVLNQSIRNWMMFLLPLLALASATWSQVPSRSVIFFIFTLLNTLFAVYLSKRFDPEQQLELFTIVGIAICFLSLLTVAVLPNAGIDHKGLGGDYGAAWQGIFPHKNISAVVLVYFVATVLTYKRGVRNFRAARAFILAVMLLLIVMSKSRTGWIVTALTMGFIWMIRRVQRLGKIEKIFAFIVIPIVATVLGIFVYANLQDILPMLGKNATLTNRIPIWNASIASALKRPMLGFGYSAFWIGFKGEQVNTAMMANDPGLMNAENGILQLWLELGFVGVAMMVGLLIRTCRNGWLCITRGGRDTATEWYLALLFITVLSVGDGDKFMLPHTLEWALYVLADIGLATKARALAERTIPTRERIQASEASLPA